MKYLYRFNESNLSDINTHNGIFKKISLDEYGDYYDKSISLGKDEGPLILDNILSILLSENKVIIDTDVVSSHIYVTYHNKKMARCILNIDKLEDDYFLVHIIYIYNTYKDNDYYKCDDVDGLYTCIKNKYLG